VSKQAVAELPPFTLLCAQLAVSVAFLAVLGRLRGERLPTGRQGRLLSRLGILNPGLAYALSLIGLTQITASLSVLLWALEPILILGLAAAVLGESLGAAILLPSLAAIAGLALAVLNPAASGSLVGVGFTVAGVAVCAVYSVGSRRWLPGTSDSTFGVVLAQQVHALGFAALATAGVAVAGWTILPQSLSAAGIASTIASGLLYYAFAYLFYLSALRSLPASVAGASFYLIPIFGVASAWLFGERLQPLQWIGAAIVVASVAAITVRPRTSVKTAEAPA
jgi:drug/metabolite transporter (DMT)-like permease